LKGGEEGGRVTPSCVSSTRNAAAHRRGHAVEPTRCTWWVSLEFEATQVCPLFQSCKALGADAMAHRLGCIAMLLLHGVGMKGKGTKVTPHAPHTHTSTRPSIPLSPTPNTPQHAKKIGAGVADKDRDKEEKEIGFPTKRLSLLNFLFDFVSQRRLVGSQRVRSGGLCGWVGRWVVVVVCVCVCVCVWGGGGYAP